MSETTQKERDNIRRLWAASGMKPNPIWKWALNDADRLAAIERQVRDMLDEMDGWNMKPGELKDAVDARLRAILDSPEGA